MDHKNQKVLLSPLLTSQRGTHSIQARIHTPYNNMATFRIPANPMLPSLGLQDEGLHFQQGLVTLATPSSPQPSQVLGFLTTLVTLAGTNSHMTLANLLSHSIASQDGKRSSLSLQQGLSNLLLPQKYSPSGEPSKANVQLIEL